MSFRKYGGTQYSANQNIVKSNINTADKFYVTKNVGQPNTYINFESDISGNIIIYGDLDVTKNLRVQKDIDCSGNLYVQEDIDCSGNLNVSKNIDTNGYLYVQEDIDCNGNLYTAGDAYINNLTVGRGGGNKITNTTFGYQSFLNNITGSDNVSVGHKALLNNNGSNNTALGSNTGIKLTGNSSNNTFLGSNTNVNTNTLSYSNSTAIGYNAIINRSNQIVLGTSSEQIFVPGSYVGIGIYEPINNFALDVSGNVNIKGNVSATAYNSSSDYRIKKDIIALDEKFNVDNFRPVTYNNINLGKQDIGLIAHELQEEYPFLVTGEKDGENLQSINYIGLIGILIKEIQELKKEVKLLKKMAHDKV
jgi:hypothetical protein